MCLTVFLHNLSLSPLWSTSWSGTKYLHTYCVPELLMPKVDEQIESMLEQGIIKHSQSPMASPLVCILKCPIKKETQMLD